MTTIIALQREHDVDLAWDGQMTVGNQKHDLLTPKVWCQNGLVFGVAGLLRGADVLSVTEFPDYDGSDARKWLIRYLVPVMREVLKEEQGVMGEQGNVELDLFVVIDGTVYEFDGMLSPVSSGDGIYTLGSGGDFARGALVAGADILRALQIAAEVDPYTGGTLTVTSANEMILRESDSENFSIPDFSIGENLKPGTLPKVGPRWADSIKVGDYPDVYTNDGPPLVVTNNYYYSDHGFTD